MATSCRLAMVSEAARFLIELRTSATPQNQDLGPQEEGTLLPSIHLHCPCSVCVMSPIEYPRGSYSGGTQALLEAIEQGIHLGSAQKAWHPATLKERRAHISHKGLHKYLVPKISQIWLSL